MLGKLRTFLMKVDHIEKIALGALFLFLTAVIMVQIIIRTFRIGNILWLEELSRLIIIESAFVSACIVTTERSHLSLDFVVQRLPKRLRYIVTGVLELFGGGLCIWTSVNCWKLVQLMIPVNMRYSTLPLPKWVIYAPITVFMFTMGLRFILVALEDLNQLRKSKETAKEEGAL